MQLVDRTVWKTTGRNRAGKGIALTLFFTTLSWYFNRPVPGSSHYPLGDIDQLFQLATLEWERWSLLYQPGSLFQGLSFYGMGDSLYFSDLLLGTLPIYVLLAAVFGPVFGFNLLHVVLSALNGLVMFGALRRLTGQPVAALTGATVFAFSPVQLRFGGHLQLQMLLWTALMVWFLVAYVQTRKPWMLTAATGSFGVQFGTAVYLGYFAALGFACLIAGAAVTGSLRLRDWRGGTRALAAVGIGLLPLIPIVAGYRGFEDDWRIARDIREVARYSAGLPGYLSDALRDQWWVGAAGNLVDANWLIRSGSPVMIPVGLAAVGIYAGIRTSRLRWVVIAAVGLTIISFVLSLGPELRWGGKPTGIALPYQFFFETFPEFRALRVAARFAMPAMLGITLLATVGVDWIWRWAGGGRSRRYALPVGLGVLLVLEFARGPVASGPLPGRDKLTDALAAVGGPAIFVPADISIWEEPIRLWVAAQARTQIVNGYSGFKPPAYGQFATLVDEAGVEDVERVLAALRAYGVRSVVLDTSRMSAGTVEGWLRAAGELADGQDPVEADQFVVVSLDGGEPPDQQSGWDRVEVDFFATGLRAGEELAAPALVTNPGPKPWLPPEGRWSRATTMTWTDEDGGQRSETGELFRVPPVVPGFSSMTIDGLVRATAPIQPGNYTLSLVVNRHVVAEHSITVFPATGPAAGNGDAAEVTVLQMSRESQVDWPARLRVAAFNVGDGAWDGSYRVGYRWLRTGKDRTAGEVAVEGRLFFSGPLAPGSAEIVGGKIETPGEPGFYLLEWGVVHEGVEWLSTASAGVMVSG
ncbi:MAG: hypothetical protein QF719_11255 [Chloroflexota bacterium]|jgi:hypothetical protein|nr:hypothetical protein [Chloroflexota bacterium]MDP6508005.1 hypothetical protein [Chloroflexota bacterium]MDP6758757.1 hypothetical protein [Chloroflexota bacterium]